MRLALIPKSAVLVFLALHLHHHFHGPPIDYLGLVAAAFASWVGLPGPGEPVLIAAGLFAARHRLDIGTVLVLAWLAATAGGIVGWLVGLKLGRRVLTVRGPFRRARARALDRGDDVFGRYPVFAILMTPSWIAGIHNVGTRRYLVINAVSAAVWAVGIGLGAYYAGPPVVDLVGDLGTVTAIGLGIVIALAVGAEIRRRRRRGRVRGVERSS